MGGNGSGRAQEPASRLDEARMALVDAQDAIVTVRSLLRQTERALQVVEDFQQEAMAVQAIVERELGFRHLREERPHRVDGLSVRVRPLRPTILAVDREQILARRQAGETLAAIGANYKVSRQRIHQIVGQLDREKVSAR